jgi:hypothetical protein
MVIYPLAIFLSAFLLFQVQPMLAKAILPWFGGTPAVWSTCMLFFQTLLLGGYLYAHGLATRVRPGKQVLIHLAVLASAVALLAGQGFWWDIPLLPHGSLKPTGADLPAARLLFVLLLAVGLPYFVLSATGPLVQAWYSRAYPNRSPYWLYVLSNVGSLLALVSYPFLVEPGLKLTMQALSWSGLYLLFGLAMAGCALLLWRQCRGGQGEVPAGPGAAQPAADRAGGCEAAPSTGARLLWVALPAVASVMLLASTNQVCQEVAVIPFLWILPLTLYLLSFIFVFAGDRWYNRLVWGIILGLATVFVCIALYEGIGLKIPGQIAAYSLGLFAVCMVCHGELVRLKPSPRYLTAFYLSMSAGGALGGLFVSLIAPWIFSGFWELHLGLWLTWVLFALVIGREPAAEDDRQDLLGRARVRAWRGIVGAAAIALGCVLVFHVASAYQEDAFTSRDFYGILRVRTVGEGKAGTEAFRLYHGAIIHGEQYKSEERRSQPATYYCKTSGIALAATHFKDYLRERGQPEALRLGVLGLGVGTLAAFGKEGDTVRFYELNPQVTELSSGANPTFTYLRDAKAAIEIVHGDGRISLERELAEGHPQRFHILAADAFSSDSIPVHLLTLEAAQLYFQHLTPDGILALHISNRYLDLKSTVARLALELGKKAALIENAGDDEGNWSSTWVLLTDNEQFLALPEIAVATSKEPPEPTANAWTDDYSNLVQAVK